MTKINYALESFKNIQDLIKFSDQKAGAALVVAGLVFTGYVQFVEGLALSVEDLNLVGFLTFVMGLITFLSLTVVVYYTIFRVLKPRKAKHYSKGELSTFYYEHIGKIGKEAIITQYKSINENLMLKDILEQQYEVSVILKEKNKNLSIVFLWLFISLVSVMLFIILSNQL